MRFSDGDNPMTSNDYPDWPTVPAEAYEVKRFPCSRCQESTADFDLDDEQVCETCRMEEMEKDSPLMQFAIENLKMVVGI